MDFITKNITKTDALCNENNYGAEKENKNKKKYNMKNYVTQRR